MTTPLTWYPSPLVNASRVATLVPFLNIPVILVEGILKAFTDHSLEARPKMSDYQVYLIDKRWLVDLALPLIPIIGTIAYGIFFSYQYGLGKTSYDKCVQETRTFVANQLLATALTCRIPEAIFNAAWLFWDDTTVDPKGLMAFSHSRTGAMRGEIAANMLVAHYYRDQPDTLDKAIEIYKKYPTDPYARYHLKLAELKQSNETFNKQWDYLFFPRSMKRLQVVPQADKKAPPLGVATNLSRYLNDEIPDQAALKLQLLLIDREFDLLGPKEDGLDALDQFQMRQGHEHLLRFAFINKPVLLTKALEFYSNAKTTFQGNPNELAKSYHTIVDQISKLNEEDLKLVQHALGSAQVQLLGFDKKFTKGEWADMKLFKKAASILRDAPESSNGKNQQLANLLSASTEGS